MNVRDRLLLEYSNLPDGTTTAGELCPVCKGGRTGERTLSVTRVGNSLLWRCHRASCSFKGASGNKAPELGYTKVPETRGITGREYQRTAGQLPASVRAYLASELHITDRHITKWNLGWDEQSSRLIQPVLDQYGNNLGCALRALDGRQPKSLTHTEQGAIAWHVNPTTAGLIIVEDIFSAIRASDYLSSVALLSTHLNDERIEAIRQSGLSPVYLALDADVYPQVIRYCQRFRNQIRMIPVKLSKDLKNHTPQELEEFLNGTTQS